ncbi:hypothetical protein NSA19_00830 [Actinomyces bowdenii]|uniref:hypothetical protein n=1 Tax=Actinomyces bowdenii TaxID=131109 RepID=UPI00214B06F8|nr:hypothetical protein [Actinomyces bowdenii]MCR2051421.1 hypothetical protein [Actinomyces bowdenii]
MRALRGIIILLLVGFAAGLVSLALIATRAQPAPDTARLNDAVQRLSAAWPHPEEAGLEGMSEELMVVDAAGRPVDLTADGTGAQTGWDGQGGQGCPGGRPTGLIAGDAGADPALRHGIAGPRGQWAPAPDLERPAPPTGRPRHGGRAGGGLGPPRR